jgi:HEAT repeat protein
VSAVHPWAALTSAVLTLLVASLLVATAVSRARRTRRAVRDAQRRAELMPLVHALLDAEDDDAGTPDLPATDPLLDELVLELLPQLRGADRAVLQAVLVRRGVVDQAVAELGARAAWRRGRAAERLGNIAGGQHVPQLAALLGDPVPDVRSAAARALGRTGEVSAVALLLTGLAARPGVPPGIVGMALLDLGTPALPALREAVNGPVAEARSLAAELLGLHGDPAAADVLVEVVADAQRDPAVRRTAATALGRIGSPHATAALVLALTSPGALDVRVAAAEALGRIGDPSGLDALTRGLRTGAPLVQVTCAEAMAAFGSNGRARLAAHAVLAGPTGTAARAALDTLDVRAAARRPAATRVPA